MSASAGPRPPLRVLVVGPGVSDGRRRAWAYVTRPLSTLGHEVHVCDSGSSPSAEAIEATFAWSVRTNRPELVVHVADGVRAHDDGVAALTAAGEAATIAVHHPFPLDPVGPRRVQRPPAGAHHLVIDVGGDDPLRTDPSAFVPARRGPSVDVVCFGPRSAAAEESVLALADAGLTFRLVDPTWDDHPLLRGVAYGRPPFRFLAHRLAIGRAVVVLPSDSAAETELRTLEASCAGRPVVGADAASADDLVARVLGALDGAAAPAPTTGWTEAWPDLIERALAVCAPAAPPRRYQSFGTLGAARPRAAVVTSVYRGADYLVDAVDSLREQTVEDIEILLLDDGSDDETTALVEALAGEDERVRGFRHDNIGQHGRFDLLAHQLIAEARAPVIAHLGGDDIAHPQRIARQLAVLDERPDVHIVCTNCVQIDGEGRVTGTIVQSDWLDKWSMLRAQMVANHVSHPTVMLRREAFDLVGPYSRGFAADYDFWTKAAAWLGFHRIVDPLVAYRVHERGSSTVGEAVTRASREFEWIRAAARRELTLLDLYPELERLDATAENVARTAAHLAAMLLSMPIKSTGAMALHETDLARRYVDDPAIGYNALYASLAAGRPPLDIVGQLEGLLAAGVAPARPLLDRIAGHADAAIGPVHHDEVFPAIAQVRPGPDDAMWYISDRSRTAHVAWAEVDWRDHAALARLLGAWCRRFPAGVAARLVLDQRGIDADDAVTAVQKAVADLDVDVTAAADIELSTDTGLRAHADVVIGASADEARLARQLGTLGRRLLFG